VTVPRVLIVATHPVQYASPQFRRLAADPRIDLTVAYLSMHGLDAEVDPEFGVAVSWDVPLLDGYRWVNPRNVAPRAGIRGFFGLINPNLWSVIQQGRFDVVICYGYRTISAWIAAAACWARRSALVWTTDATSLAPRDGAGWKRAVKGVILPLIFRSGSAAIAPSTRSAQFLRSLGVRPDRVYVTPYVVDNEYFQDRAAVVDVAAVRREIAVPEGATLALFVGKLVPWKRPADLIHAIAHLDGVHVVLAGEGPDRTSLQVLAKELGLAERVSFLGFKNQSELPALYAAADILVLPSEYEAFGLVVNEAFACGTPALVSDACGAAGDLVIDGVTGYSFPAGDVEGLADRLARLRSTAGELERLGLGAAERIADWGPQQSLDATIDAVQSIAVLSGGVRRR
jgi:glycosyltransferase involved in cell wall biosynthesis